MCCFSFSFVFYFLTWKITNPHVPVTQLQQAPARGQSHSPAAPLTALSHVWDVLQSDTSLLGDRVLWAAVTTLVVWISALTGILCSVGRYVLKYSCDWWSTRIKCLFWLWLSYLSLCSPLGVCVVRWLHSRVNAVELWHPGGPWVQATVLNCLWFLHDWW